MRRALLGWLIGLALWQACHAAEGPSIMARTVKGILTTSRSVDGGKRRHSHEGPLGRRQGLADSAQQDSTWLLAFPSELQHTVYNGLRNATLPFQILHPVPSESGTHWLVRATPSTIQYAASLSPLVTMARMPDDYKSSPVVDGLIESCKGLDKTACDDKVEQSFAFLARTPEPDLQVTVTALVPGINPTDLALLVQQASTELPRLIHQSGSVWDALGRMWSSSDSTQPAGSGCALRAEVAGPQLAITVCAWDVGTVSTWLTAQAAVTWVDLQPKGVTSNLLADAVTQADGKFVDNTPPFNVLSPTGADVFLPFWAQGLDGKGQIVGLVDTGVDLDSCYLWDPNYVDYQDGNSTFYVPPNNSSRLSNYSYFYNPNHRKVIYYGFISDSVDDAGGHGTHVAGSLVGSRFGANATGSPDLATGMVPGAKIAVMDVSNGTIAVNRSRLVDTGIEYSKFWDPLRELGARVTSNSWGQQNTDNFVYNQPICYMLDTYTWTYQDTLHVFAAGNGGYQTGFLATGTAEAPATCKNTLSVGSSEGWIQGGIGLNVNATARVFDGSLTSDFRGPWDHGQLIVTSPDGQLNVTLDSLATDFSPILGFDSRPDLIGNTTMDLVLTGTADLCALLRNATKYTKPTIVMLRTPFNGPACPLGISVSNALELNVTGVLVMLTDQPQTLQVTTSFLSNLNRTFPAAIVRTFLGNRIVRYMTANGTTNGLNSTLQLQWRRNLPRFPPHENIAFYSAYSPLANLTQTTDFVDRRFKPDLVTPGYTMSATAKGGYSGVMDQCDTNTLWGTSMSTPIAAGAAVIIRQYFTEGWYPNAVKGSGPSFQPSAPLLKAVLIAGAVSMRGVSRANNQPLAPAPSPFQGFGRVRLTGALPLRNDGFGWRMQLLDNAQFFEDGVSQTYTVFVNETSKPLIVTLVYNDYAGFPGAQKVQVNDLNLWVQGPLEDPTSATVKRWGNNVIGGDPYNNVEKVFLGVPKNGTYRIGIDSAYLFIAARPQNYSLVVIGGISTTINSPYNPATRNATANVTNPAPPPPRVSTPPPPAASPKPAPPQVIVDTFPTPPPAAPPPLRLDVPAPPREFPLPTNRSAPSPPAPPTALTPRGSPSPPPSVVITDGSPPAQTATPPPAATRPPAPAAPADEFGFGSLPGGGQFNTTSVQG